MAPGDHAITAHGLTKRFGSRNVVDGVDLAVPAGSVFGFLGPNGSGKTTTIRMLLGLITATSGEATVLGERMPDRWASVLPRVGALVEGPGFAPYLSGTANLRRLDSADGRSDGRSRSRRIGEALERVGLTAAAGKKVKAYSLGMKQRLGLANALLRPRELLVLDEPTNGLDPQGTREVRSLIRTLTGEGTTVFVSSHLLAEIEQLCSHVGVMRAGRVVAQGTIEELRGHDHAVVHIRTPDTGGAARVLTERGLTPLLPHTPGGELTAALPEDVAPESLVAALVAAEVRVRAFTVDEPTLEDRFVALTGEGFDVES